MDKYFEVFDLGINSLGIVDVYDEIVWERRYYESGYFELHAPATDNNLKLLAENRILYQNSAEESGLITAIFLSEEDGTGKITVCGRFLSFLLHKRLIKSETVVSGNAETIMRKLVTDVMANNEGFEIIKLGEISKTSGTYSAPIGYGDLHDTLSMISMLSGTAFRLRLSPAEKLIYFECYEGKDRSVNQTENPQIVFSADYDNILSSAQLTRDITPEINAATVRYSGEYGEISLEYNPLKLTGLDKKEIYIDEVPKTKRSGGTTVIDEEATIAEFTKIAKEAITAPTFDFTCAVSYEGEYRAGYDLGDIVTVYKKEWGITKSLRITTMTENTTAAGYSVIPVFGEPFPSGLEE